MIFYEIDSTLEVRLHFKTTQSHNISFEKLNITNYKSKRKENDEKDDWKWPWFDNFVITVHSVENLPNETQRWKVGYTGGDQQLSFVVAWRNGTFYCVGDGQWGSLLTLEFRVSVG